MAASTSHLSDVMSAIRARIKAIYGPADTLSPDVEIGNPAQFHPRPDTAPPLVTLFVYRIEPDHAAMLATPNSAAAMRLHTLITVYCSAGETESETAGMLELRILSDIIRLFHENPQLGPVRIREAVPVGPIASLVTSDLMIEARQMAPDMEEINHIWTTQGEAPYRTSLDYRFAFGIITPSSPSDEGPPVLRTELRDVDHPDPDLHPIGVTPFLPSAAEEPEPALGVLSINSGTPAAPVLLPAASFTVGAGDPSLALVGVTENAETLDLVLETFDQVLGEWTDVSGTLSGATITTLEREVLQQGGAVTATNVSFTDPGSAGVVRLSAVRAVEPEGLLISPVFITMEAA